MALAGARFTKAMAQPQDYQTGHQGLAIMPVLFSKAWLDHCKQGRSRNNIAVARGGGERAGSGSRIHHKAPLRIMPLAVADAKSHLHTLHAAAECTVTVTVIVTVLKSAYAQGMTPGTACTRIPCLHFLSVFTLPWKHFLICHVDATHITGGPGDACRLPNLATEQAPQCSGKCIQQNRGQVQCTGTSYFHMYTHLPSPSIRCLT